MSGDILIRREGAAGRITLNRPKALNALTLEMVLAMLGALEEWRHDERVKLVIVDGAGERGLCAGGDIRALYNSGQSADGLASRFWADEYRLNALISEYPKPYVAIMDGIVMGGGVGVSAHGSHRVVTERSRVAMPETGIGFFPDVGGTWLLANAPGSVGAYLGLTGLPFGGEDAIYAGFADVLIDSSRLAEVVDTLCQASYSRDANATVDTLLRGYASPVGTAPLARNRAEIDRVCHHETVEEILAAAKAQGSEWGDKLAQTLASRSPTSLKVTHEAVKRARSMPSLEAVLDMEYRLSLRIFAGKDFYEGVRAVVIDKTGDPKWSPASLEEVTAEAVEAYFAPFDEDEGELGLETA